MSLEISLTSPMTSMFSWVLLSRVSVRSCFLEGEKRRDRFQARIDLHQHVLDLALLAQQRGALFADQIGDAFQPFGEFIRGQVIEGAVMQRGDRRAQFRQRGQPVEHLCERRVDARLAGPRARRAAGRRRRRRAARAARRQSCGSGVVACSARWVWVVDSGTARFGAAAGAASGRPGRWPVARPAAVAESGPRSMFTVSVLIWSSPATARDSGSRAALIWAISSRLRVRVPILRSSSSSRASRPRPARHSRPIRSRRTPSSWPDCAS